MGLIYLYNCYQFSIANSTELSQKLSKSITKTLGLRIQCMKIRGLIGWNANCATRHTHKTLLQAYIKLLQYFQDYQNKPNLLAVRVRFKLKEHVYWKRFKKKSVIHRKYNLHDWSYIKRLYSFRSDIPQWNNVQLISRRKILFGKVYSLQTSREISHLFQNPTVQHIVPRPDYNLKLLHQVYTLPYYPPN